MNMHVPTPTEARAHQRHIEFKRKIAEAAEQLRRPARQLRELRPESFPAETDPPREKHWFRIVGESEAISEPPCPTIRQIQDAVCAHFAVSRIDLISSRRVPSIVGPRLVACYLCQHLTKRGLSEIGRRFGDRDHATIRHAVLVTEQRMLRDAALAHDIAILTELIAGPE